ncbi:helix-turn-helix transcriptional regulator [Pontibacter sp. KCTC 32443]|uniref:response regulator transcription factor n=1 Tax=Pontibacter TaxID=323449 RepID=UPI00164E4EC5|nr:MULTISPECIES: helix-turn-helix transcriptional regulator [Pontibacter]MBC5774746.1 helix-turn-helix transcriptional regulator [Pontibacter sp. KCTC 32443]
MNQNDPEITTKDARRSLEERMQQKIAEIDAVVQDLPAVVIIHNFQKGFTVEYMSPYGAKLLGFTLEEIRNLGEEYHYKFFNQEDVPDYLAKASELIEQNNKEMIVSLFQQVRASENHPWKWYLTTLKILMWDDEGKPLLTIGLAFPIDPLHHVTSKVSRLLDENNFLRKNYNRFSKLSGREREVLRHIALGKSAAESADELCISATTVETHRRNIKRKLETSSFFELSQYARAFDLI